MTENDQNLDARLRALARADAGLSAPPRVEAALAHAFRARGQRRRLAWLGAAGALAASLLVAAWMLPGWKVEQRQGGQAEAPRATAELSVAPKGEGPEVKPRATETVQQARALRTKRARPAERIAQPDVATEFIALHAAPPLAPGDAAQVVRVRVPRAELRRFGLSPIYEFPEGQVQADVVLGQDGIARAVRFIH